MLCNICEKREATFHLSEIRDDTKREFHLCARCARETRMNLEFSEYAHPFKEMLFMLDLDIEDFNNTNTHICMICGLTNIDFMRDSKLGCPSCYKYLKSALNPQRLGNYNKRKHIGKKPFNYIEVNAEETNHFRYSRKELKTTEIVDEIKEELEIAVIEERYEDAAKLRDKVREIERVE